MTLVGQTIWERATFTRSTRQWVVRRITGETSRSYAIDGRREPVKLPKAAFRNGACPPGWALTDEHKRQVEHAEELALWVQAHAYRIGDSVQRCRDAERLARVAEIVGYAVTPPPVLEAT